MCKYLFSPALERKGKQILIETNVTQALPLQEGVCLLPQNEYSSHSFWGFTLISSNLCYLINTIGINISSGYNLSADITFLIQN
jgi:hypothetical protein